METIGKRVSVSLYRCIIESLRSHRVVSLGQIGLELMQISGNLLRARSHVSFRQLMIAKKQFAKNYNNLLRFVIAIKHLIISMHICFDA